MRASARKLAAAGMLLLWAALSGPAHGADAKRGGYVFKAAGCADCHTDRKHKGKPLAGGRALKTPFGTFYAPNITPDEKTGIGGWTEAQFVKALRRGIGPDGSPYFPAFPYGSYSRMTKADAADLWAYLSRRPAVKRKNKAHDLNFPFGWRFLVWFWRWLYFDDGALPAAAEQSAAWRRGRYLAVALGHCGECHTPRNFLGGLKADMALAGNGALLSGVVPNITPDKATGIGKWSADDYDSVLTLGMLPDGDFVEDEMAEVAENTNALRPEDRAALILYLRSVPAVRNNPSKTDKPATTD